MTPRFPEPRSVALVHGEASLDLPPLPPGSCLLLAAAHDELLTLSLVDPQSSVLARDTGHRFNLLDAGGPLCVRKGDGLRLLLKGQGVAWIQLWSKAPPSP